MSGKCRFCKSKLELGILSKNELKLAQYKVPSVKDNDLFCKKCHTYLTVIVDNLRNKRREKQLTLSISEDSGSEPSISITSNYSLDESSSSE